MAIKGGRNTTDKRTNVIVSSSNILFIPVRMKDISTDNSSPESVIKSDRQMSVDGIIDTKERVKTIEKNVIRLFEKELNRRQEQKRKLLTDMKTNTHEIDIEDSTNICDIFLADEDNYDIAASLYSLLSSESGGSENLEKLLENMVNERENMQVGLNRNIGFDDDNLASVNIQSCITEECNNIHCWWDTQAFATSAIGIPVSCNIEDQRVQFMTHGVSCSYNCALSYLI